MKDVLPTISPDGIVNLDWELSGWWLKQCLDECVEELRDPTEHSDLAIRFLKGAYRLARESVGMSFPWNEIADEYSAASGPLALGRATAINLLRVAHTLAKARLSHWTDLGRQWVCVGEDMQMLHLSTGEVLDQVQFCMLFAHLNPRPGDALLSVLFDADAIEHVAEVRPETGSVLMFTGRPGELVLHLPRDGVTCLI